MNYLAQVFFTTALFLVMFTNCTSLNAQQYVIYDKSIPAEQTCTLKHSMAVTTRKFNGKTVSWNKPVIIPAGEHDFVVDYKWDKPIGGNRVERQTAKGITVRYKFMAGNVYTMWAETDDFSKTGRVIFKNDTEIAAEKERERERVEAEYKAMLPNETTEPTEFEGAWKAVVEGWSPTYISFKGNTWQYSEGSKDQKGLFIISNDTLKLIRLFERWDGGEWKPDNDYRNAVSEYRFVFEEDGGFLLTTIKGFAKRGTFHKEQAQ